MNSRFIAIVAASVATLIYGVNYTIAKDVMPLFVMPFGLIVLRVFGAMVLFWFLGLFVKKENIEKKDFIANMIYLVNCLCSPENGVSLFVLIKNCVKGL